MCCDAPNQRARQYLPTLMLLPLERGGVFPPIVQFRTTGRSRCSVCFRYSETRGRYRRCDRSAFWGRLAGPKHLNSLCVLHILVHSNRPILPILSDEIRCSQIAHNPDVPDGSIHTEHTEHTVHQLTRVSRTTELSACFVHPPLSGWYYTFDILGTRRTHGTFESSETPNNPRVSNILDPSVYKNRG